jgi:AcrR family transcriptional regulator
VLRQSYDGGVDDAGTRRRGRYIEAARNDRAVLEAAREVFTRQGFDAPVSAVAARARCGMGSLYRRYPTKEALLQRLCVLAMEQAIEAAEAGLRHDDPWSGLAHYVRECVAAGTGALAPVAGTVVTTPQMQAASERVMEAACALVARAQAARVLRSDVTCLDLALLVEQFGRRAPQPWPDEDAALARLVTIALDGLRAPGTEPLPGDPPDPARHAQRLQPAPAR